MVVYFYTDWCSYCRTLDEQYLSAPSVRRVLERTVAVRINPESGPAERQIAARYGVDGYPTFLVINNESAQPRELQPFRKGGNHLTPQQFAQDCDDAVRMVPVSRNSTRPDESPESLESQSNRAVMNATRQTRGVQIVEVPRPATAAPAKIKKRRPVAKK
jgi:thiol:disulfide interchange protein